MGNVIAQDPAEGQKAKDGSTVVITVSSGPGTATFTDLHGLTEADARTRLTDLGFTNVKSRSQPDDTAEPGTVLFTEPTAGTYPTDQLITLVLAAAPDTTTTSSTTTTSAPPTTTTPPTTTSPPTTTAPPTTTSPPTTTQPQGTTTQPQGTTTQPLGGL